MYRRIRDLREDRDMTQVQLAKMLNCSQRTYRVDGRKTTLSKESE